MAEAYDGFLNDINAFHVTKEHAFQALDSASGGPVAEGKVGGDTGMMYHGFKGGIGSASRIAEVGGASYTVGTLVQADYGHCRLLRDVVPLPGRSDDGEGSIIVIVATNVPLIPIQCKRLVQRATIGLARAGGVGHIGSGDIFLAFSTGNHPTQDFSEDDASEKGQPIDVQMIPNHRIDPLFEATTKACRRVNSQRPDRRRNYRGIPGSHSPRHPIRHASTGDRKVSALAL